MGQVTLREHDGGVVSAELAPHAARVLALLERWVE